MGNGELDALVGGFDCDAVEELGIDPRGVNWARMRSGTPVSRTPGSVMTKQDREPSRPTSSAISSSAPSPNFSGGAAQVKTDSFRIWLTTHLPTWIASSRRACHRRVLSPAGESRQYESLQCSSKTAPKREQVPSIEGIGGE